MTHRLDVSMCSVSALIVCVKTAFCRWKTSLMKYWNVLQFDQDTSGSADSKTAATPGSKSFSERVVSSKMASHSLL